MPAPSVGFIGLGQMGVSTRRYLLRADSAALRFDPDPQAVAAFADETGFNSNSKPGLAVQGCTTLILLLPDSGVVDRS